MSTSVHPVKNATRGIEILFLTALIWMLRGYVWPTLSSVEVSALQAKLDPSLFHHDFIVQESLRFTPRFYYNELILSLTHLGLSLAWAFAAWQLLAIAVLISGIRALAREIGASHIASSVLLLWVLTVDGGTIGSVFFYTHAPVPAVWAGSLITWGALFSIRQRWSLAYIFFAAATLLQFLVGFYAGLLALPFLIKADRKICVSALAIWSVGLGLVFGPMWLGGVTGSGELSSTAFVEIYAKLRHPHHLVPSIWGLKAWLTMGSFYIGAWWFLRKTGGPHPSLERRVCNSSLIIMTGCLLLNFLGIELYPLAIVAKLQPARITPLVQTIFLLALGTRIEDRAKTKDWMGALILFFAVLSPIAGLWLLSFAWLTTSVLYHRPYVRYLFILGILLSFGLDGSLHNYAVHFVLSAVILLAPIFIASTRDKPALLNFVSAGSMAIAALCAVLSTKSTWPPFLTARFAIAARAIDGPGIIGQRFGEYAPKDAIVLIPPAGETWTFKLYARRAVVVDDKNFPFTDRGMREWKHRMDDVLGPQREPLSDPAEAWRSHSSETLVTIASHYAARYVLTKDIWHSSLPGKSIEKNQGWTLWELD